MRKSSPGKALFSSANALQTSLDRSATSPVRSLDFNSQAASQMNQSLSQPGNSVPMQSWADKVRGTTSRASATAAVKTTDLVDRQNQNANSRSRNLSANDVDCIVQDVKDDGDEEGWETVHHGRKMHSHSKKNKAALGQATNGKTGVKLKHSIPTETMNGASSSSDGDNQGVYKVVVKEPTVNPVKASEKSMEISYDQETEYPLDDNGYEEQASLSDIEHEKALSAATEQEENLSRQIEECQNQMIASVIEHEESLTKEIAEEEELVTAINGEKESPVSDNEQNKDVENIHNDGDDSLNCSSTANGDNVSAYISSFFFED